MPERPVFTSPIAGPGEASGEGWRLSDESATPKLLVYEDFEPGGVVQRRLGVPFGASVAAGGVLVCGVRPGEWLLLGPPACEPVAGDDGAAAVPTPPAFPASTAAVDATHGLAMFRLTGPAAPDVLAATCGIDTAEAMLPDGAVCGASIARVACTLVRNDFVGERSYLVLADRSYGRYLFQALSDAGGSRV